MNIRDKLICIGCFLAMIAAGIVLIKEGKNDAFSLSPFCGAMMIFGGVIGLPIIILLAPNM